MKELRFHGQAIITGRGSLDYLANIEGSRFFIVTGQRSVFENGTIDRIKSILSSLGHAVYIYSGIPKNPSVEVVLDGLEHMRQFRPDVVVGIGGGSAIDAAKVLSLYYEYPDVNVEVSLMEAVPEKRSFIKLIAIPGTSGTAAEVTRTSVITFKKDNIKIGVKSPALIPDIAILDVDLALSMPPHVVAESGMDALAHAVECFINKNIDDFSEHLAASAIEGIFNYLPASYSTGSIEAREKIHNFQCLAGCAFANVGTGMNHGIAHAFGGTFDFGHGLLIAVALPYVLEFNQVDPEVNRRLQYLAKRVDQTDFIDGVRKLNQRLSIPASFQAMGLSEQDYRGKFDLLLENSMKGSTARNPVPVSRNAMAAFLDKVYYGK
jgi:alcohol dehydrogenase class IV